MPKMNVLLEGGKFGLFIKLKQGGNIALSGIQSVLGNF
jgi:hypothetical protein